MRRNLASVYAAAREQSGIEFDREAWRQRLHAPLGESPSTGGPGSQ
jgi:hypothetical protein